MSFYCIDNQSTIAVDTDEETIEESTTEPSPKRLRPNDLEDPDTV
jgi:hypothetical protein